MRSTIITVLSLIITTTILQAQVTYSEQIAPIIYKNCSTCHRTGEIGPFTLTNYDEVSNWAENIKFVTQSRYMPPWKPDTEYSTF